MAALLLPVAPLLPFGGGTVNATTRNATVTDGWSGYAAGYGPFTGVAGTFTVPAIGATPWETFTDIWVGIDGIGPESPLIQAGIEELYDPATGLHTQAWWETLPAHPLKQLMDGVTVRPGDRISVAIDRISRTRWQIALTNHTTGATFDTFETYAGPATSAEWIVEAPTAPDGTRERLGPYHPAVTFSGLQAKGSRTALTAMALVQDGVPVATPGAWTASGFRITYVGAATLAPPLHVQTILAGQLVGLPASGGVPCGQVQWQVSADLVHWSVLTTLTLDGAGQSTYTFAPSRTAYYRVRFDATGTYGREIDKVVVVQPPPPSSPTPSAPAASGSISGTVLGPDGAPAAGMQVAAYRFPEHGAGLATTAADGTYTMANLVPGTYRMAVSDPTGALPGGYVDGSRLTPFGPLASVIAVDRSGAQVSVQVPAGETISGTVTARGRRLAGIHVFACGALDSVLPETGLPNCGTATTAADGTYSIAVLPGPYTVVTGLAKPYPWTFYATAGATLDGAAATVLDVTDADISGIDVALRPAPLYPTLAGRVTDSHGLPLSGIFVDACATAAPAECAYASSSPDGSYSIDLPAGTYTVAFDDPSNGHPSGFYGANGFVPTLPEAVPVTVSASGVRGIDVQLPEGHLVTGTVTGPDGTPLADIQVAPCASPACSGQASSTGPDGRYTLDLAAGTYLLHYTDWSGLYLSGSYASSGLANAAGATPVAVTPVAVGTGDVTGLDLALHGISATASPGVTRAGPFATGRTVVAGRGGYVTVRVAVGKGFAGSTVEIQVATQDPQGQWSAFQGVTTRLVGADGCAYDFVRRSGPMAIRVGLRDPAVSALQAAGGLGDVEVFSNPVVVRGA
ncbi:MAG: G1 family glutamic endopeptidase [Candidatus Limnocylindrales bacterium]